MSQDQDKYKHRHVKIAISEKDILKPYAVGRDFSELNRNDFQDWFLEFGWQYGRGMSGVERSGKNMSQPELHKFGTAMCSYDGLVNSDIYDVKYDDPEVGIDIEL